MNKKIWCKRGFYGNVQPELTIYNDSFIVYLAEKEVNLTQKTCSAIRRKLYGLGITDVMQARISVDDAEAIHGKQPSPEIVKRLRYRYRTWSIGALANWVEDLWKRESTKEASRK